MRQYKVVKEVEYGEKVRRNVVASFYEPDKAMDYVTSVRDEALPGWKLGAECGYDDGIWIFKVFSEFQYENEDGKMYVVKYYIVEE